MPNVAERLRVRLPWRSASTRLIMLYGALFVVWGTALIGFINWETRCYLGRIVDQIVEQRMLYLTGVGRDKLPEAMVAAGALDLRGYTQVGLFDRNHRLITGNLLVRPPGLPSDGHIHDVIDTVKRIDGSVIPHMRGVAQSLAGGEELVLVRDAGVVDRVGVIIGRSLLWGLSLTIIPGIVGGLLLARGPRRRIEQIREATERVIGGELSRRLPVSGRGDELDMLASIVNRMLVEIERLIVEVKGVCDNIAHDLRTPLTRLRAQLHRLRQQTPADDARGETIEQCIVDTDALLGRFRALLRISELEDIRRRVGFDRIELGATLRQVHELYAPLAEDKGIRFVLELDGPLPVAADAGLLFEAVSNLVSNAVKFTPPGGRMHLRARAEAQGPRIEVLDSGPGIPPAERGAVLQRFYRSECGKQAPGYGLGLSIVAAIVRLHDFQLEIGQADGDGARISLCCWPAEITAARPGMPAT